MKPSAVNPSSIGASGGPRPRIWKKWSITQIESKPTASAVRVTRASVGPIAAGPPGPVTSIGKLYFCPLVEDLADFALSLDPLGGQFDPADEDGESARWLRLAYQARGTAIAGGSTFIQRNIVAERMLKMPRS